MTIEKALDKFFSNLIKGVRADMVSKKLVASGRSSDSLVYGTDSKGGELVGNQSIYFIIYGRGPGKMPPVNDILSWVKIKGLGNDEKSNKSIAFAIAKKISKEGTSIFKGKKKGLEFDKIAEDNLDILGQDLGEAVRVGVTNNLAKAFGPELQK